MKTKEELRRIMPERIRMLGHDAIGNPLLYFAERGANGLMNYRAVRAEAVDRCITHGLCYICGQPLGRNKAFLTGPVGALRQIAIDPPCHRGCAVFAAQACPYFTAPRLRPDAMLTNNACCVWTTRSFTSLPIDNAIHYHLGKPIEVTWFSQGEPASHEQVLRAMQSALRILLDVARDDSEAAVNAVLQSVARLRQYMPAEGGHGNQPATAPRGEGGGNSPRQAAGGCQ